MTRSLISAACAAVSLVLLPGPIAAAPALGPAAFGTVAVAAGTTPYDARWRSVQSQALGSGAVIATGASRLQGVERLQYVNRAVNAAISYRADASDSWARASDSFRRAAGDCEDYAIAKLQVLRVSGFPSADLFLMIGRDLAVGSDHALLVVRLGGSYWVLDNFTDQVTADTGHGDFRPIITLSSGGRWVHGYKAGAPQVLTAAAPTRDLDTASGTELAAVIATQAAG